MSENWKVYRDEIIIPEIQLRDNQTSRKLCESIETKLEIARACFEEWCRKELEILLRGGDDAFDRNWAGPPHLKPRAYRTQSEKDTWMAVAVENEYNCPALAADDVVIDVGAHIGSFAHLAYRMGSRSIYAFEIDPWHVEAGQQNLAGMDDGVAYYHCAVVRSDEHRAPEYHYNGAWNSFGVVGPVVESRSLDEILAPHESVRFLKLDCEGGEWPLLYTSTLLDRIQEIAGEYHIVPTDAPEMQNLPLPVDSGALMDFLYAKGFAVTLKPASDTIGLFHAIRRKDAG